MKYHDMQLLWGITRGERLRYGSAAVALALATALLLAVSEVISRCIDDVIGPALASPGAPGTESTLVGGLWLSFAGVLLFTAVAGALQYLRGRWAGTASETIVRRLRNQLYDQLSHLPVRFHERSETGDLVQRCTSDVETLRTFLVQQVTEMGRAALLFIFVLPIFFSIHAPLAWVAISLYPIIFVSAFIFFRHSRRLFQSMDEAEGKLTTVIQENLTGIRVVRAFARQEFEQAKFDELNGRFRNHTERWIHALGTFFALSDVICFAQLALVILCGAHWARAGELPTGQYFQFIFCTGIVIWPLRHFGRVLADSGKALVAIERIAAILDREPETSAQDLPEELAIEGGIVFDGVTYRYDEDAAAAIDRVSLSIAPGETVAFVGPPGAGKSTLVQLLLRLRDPGQGRVLVDGRDLRELSRRAVRARVGTVLQEAFLYSKSIEENLRVGRSGATDDELVAVARDADLDASIRGFENGYQTAVGERGVTLSGGQRQRMAIARALLKDPPVLILDDALSAVDTRTESRILAALRQRRARRTTIIIAHRLSTVAAADRVVVLEAGRIVQQGSHAELSGVDGPYRRLWRIQEELESSIASDDLPEERR